jgi:epoxyqueuosine reductase
MSLKDDLKAEANHLGFLLAGVTLPGQPRHFAVYEDWLAQGRHASMAYLANERARQLRADPRLILPEVRSILVLGLPYDPPATPPAERRSGRIAAYAQGQDYHLVIPPRLAQIVHFMEERLGRTIQWRGYTDTGPLLERELAMQAGLGWIGKNTCLISPHAGSYFLLAEVLWDVELEADRPIDHDYCGTCRRCIEACPTDCIAEDRTIDARRCISYLTIENKGSISPELRPLMGDWVFGCDVCQQVCPWNIRFAPLHGDLDLSAQPEKASIDLNTELHLSSQEFNRKYRLSPLLRPHRRGYLRNISVAMGNTANPGAVSALAETLARESEPLVRAHAAWALGRLAGAPARAALEETLTHETDPEVLREIRAALQQSQGSQAGSAAS